MTGTSVTLRDVFVATSSSDQTLAIRFEDERWTHADLRDHVGRLANVLRDELGVGPGQRVAIAMRNYPEWLTTFWATQAIGAVTVGCNAWFGPAELAQLVEATEPAVVVADAERVTALAATGTHERQPVIGVRQTDLRPGVLSYSDLLATAPTILPEVVVDPADASTIFFTSGTTSSKPKGVPSTHLNHMMNIRQLQARASLSAAQPAGVNGSTAPPGAALVVYPLFHIAGLALAYSSVTSGAAVLLLRKWDTTQAAALIEDHDVRAFSGPPPTVRDILDVLKADPHRLPSIRTIGFGGSLAPASNVSEISKVGGRDITPTTGYGLTETTGTVCSHSGSDFIERPASIGRPLGDVSVRIVDESMNDVESGHPGELIVRGEQVVSGYLDLPDATSAAFVNGWFRTGDLVRQDEDGFLYIVGRLKDVIIRGGENVSAGEVEAAILTHPDVAECAVLGRPSNRWGEEVCAIVRAHPGADLTASDVVTHVSGLLASFKVPAFVELVDVPLPRNAAGKILKRSLRMPVATESD